MEDIFDGIHHSISSFWVGLRDNIIDLNDKNNEEIKVSNDEYFDSKFFSLKKRIKSTRINTSRFDRINAGNKFNINTIEDDKKGDDDYDPNNNNTEDKKEGEGITYLDSIILQLEKAKIDKQITDKLIYYLLFEEYCTESLVLDIKMNKGNISTHLNNKKCIDCIDDMLKETEKTDGAFSIGYDWNYWRDSFIDARLHVNKKYENLKEEILSYQYLNIGLYDEEILPKATAFEQTQLVKSLKANTWCYGINKGDPINIDMLICIILYTDYTKLSTHFGGTFRKNNTYEPIQSVKKRNQNYYWFARRLKNV